MSCSVKNCFNSKRFRPEGIRFHRFPKGELLKKWIDALELGDDWKWSANKFVCSKHFHASDLITIGKNQIRLRADAVPVVRVSASKVAVQQVVTQDAPLGESSTSVEVSLLQSSKSSSDDTIRKGKKRPIGSSSGHETSVSTDSSTKRKRAKFIKTVHSYAISPSKVKSKYVHLQQVQAKSRKKLYSARRTVQTLKKKITSLETVVAKLKEEQSLSDNAIEHLEKCYQDIPHILMRRYLKNVSSGSTTREMYPEKLRNFACTLHFYSSKAYEYVRGMFALSLPHQSVIRKWCANINCYPGFCDTSFEVLEIKVAQAKKQGREIIVSLMLDEMAVKKQVEFDGKRMWGYVDTGVPIENDELQPATEALVLLVTCHTSHWKLPIAYFFIKSLSSSEKANVINEGLIRLHEVGVTVTSVTCDGPSVHFKMLNELGCNLDDVENLKTSFSHPADNNLQVFCILDVCHMLKLLRNLLGTLKAIVTRDGRVEWAFIQKLFDLQEKETLRIANKLKKSHIQWQKQKMKVDLAAQTLSESVANALEFLDQEFKLPDFEGVKPTVLFIRRINQLFDLLNSRSPFARGFKGPMREDNEEVWRPFLLDTCNFLLECTDVGGRPLYMTPRKTPILGFIMSSLSLMGVFDKYVKTNRLNYLLTYKCSQDHLEIFFCSVRYCKVNWCYNNSSYTNT